MSGTVDREEIERFTALAQAWWDPEGDFKPLHVFNPTRIAYIRERLSEHLRRNADDPEPFKGLRLLDIGCGGGLLSEPMSRLGAKVTGIDAGEKNIRIARAHARESGLSIDYRHGTAEELAAGNDRFDAILSMEVVEHVADRTLFIESCCALLKPGGGMIVATLNRTMKSYALAIIGAEYVLRWLPRGTHNWKKFVRPSELAAELRRKGLEVADITGMTYDPFSGDWSLSRDVGVNYLLFAIQRK